MEALVQVNSKGNKKDLEDVHRRRCKKDFSSGFSCIEDKRRLCP